MPKTKEFVSSSDASGSEDERPKKKAKKEEKPKKEKKKRESSDSEEEDGKIHLGNKKFVSVREFKGKILIDIREFYDAGGELKPGKKGISLNADQWCRLRDKIDDIDAKIDKM